MDTNSNQEVCVEIVKFEVSSDEGDDPTIIDSDNDGRNHTQFEDTHLPSTTTTTTIPTPTTEANVIQPLVPPSSELIRLFGHTTSQPIDIDGNPILQAGSLASQLCPLGPKERCTPSQAQAMGQQILQLMAVHETNGAPLPFELQNTFDIFHRCLAVAYGTFFLNLYTKANAPCVLCHGCKSLYPPGQYIHHSCLALPPNIVPCRSRMWRRCLVPLMSLDMNKVDQKERWKFVLEKFSHASVGVGKRNIAHLSVEPQLLEMPECKRGKFVGGSDVPDKNHVKTNKLLKGKETQLTDDVIDTPVPPVTPIPLNNEHQSPLVKNDYNSNCLSDEELNGGLDLTLNEKLNTNSTTSKSFGIIKELLKEVTKLEQELTETKEKLKQTNEKLKLVTSGDSLSEKFVQSLLSQEKVTIEKNEIMKKLQQEVEKSTKLSKQLDKIQLLHLEMQNQFR